MRNLADWLSYPRSYLVTLFFGALTLVEAAIVIFMAVVLQVSRKALNVVVVSFWSRPLLWCAGVQVEARGLERIHDRHDGFLIVFNHSSLMDIPVLFTSIPRLFNFGAKIELFSIPIFGRAMAKVGALPIDRNNRNKVMKIYNDAIARVKNGESFALAPEGTRQQEPAIGKFKRGPFEFALNAQMDLVPVVIAGAFQVLPRSSIWINAGKWKRKVLVEVLNPVSTAGLGLEKVEALQEQVRASMEESFKRLMQELEVSAPKPLS